MLLNSIKQFNWVDVFVVFLLLRIIYVSIKNGFVIELFKFLGTVFAIYIAFHYFTALSDIFMRKVPGDHGLTLDFMDFLICLILLSGVYLVFVSLRSLLCHFVKMEAVPALSKWGGFILGVFRGFLAASLLVFLLFISTFGYLSASAKHSFLGRQVFNISIATYSGIWNGFMDKLSGGEKFNPTITEIQQAYSEEK